ncbi:hypothetical protein COO60DRAFT_62433 [Scenedesmus sp. NREL 46B-D3]|nr:hypothetical protein COO60DRAFT_62433 [Scenedesmus sp. NREL 46B-D3]
MAMLGRFRRRIAAAALSRLISEGVLPASVLLEQPARLARLAGVMVKVCEEVDRFAGDIAHLDGLDFEQELNSDFVLAARLSLSKGDAVRHLDVFATFQTAVAALAAAAGGEAGLMALLQAGAGTPPSPAMRELQPLVSSLLRGTLAAQLAAQKQLAAAAGGSSNTRCALGEEAMVSRFDSSLCRWWTGFNMQTVVAAAVAMAAAAAAASVARFWPVTTDDVDPGSGRDEPCC